MGAKFLQGSISITSICRHLNTRHSYDSPFTGTTDQRSLFRSPMTVGDSILKLAMSIHPYGGTTKCAGEGRLTQMRELQINKKNLHKLGSENGLGGDISSDLFDVTSNLLPQPTFNTTGFAVEEMKSLIIQQLILRKNVPYRVKTLLGVYLLSMGIKGALTLMDWFGLKTIPSTVVKRNEKNGFPLLEVVENEEESAAVEELYISYGLESLERRLNYTFKNKSLLVEALTHGSYSSNRVTNCYQRLEFLGDAVLDYLITRYFYDDPRQFSPAMLTHLRSATVNNRTFAVVAVRNGFHRHLVHLSLPLIDSFVKSQEENGHLLLHDRFVLGNASCRVASNVSAPKVLGDSFESVAGAIFIDSGMSLDSVSKSYSPLLQEDMGKRD